MPKQTGGKTYDIVSSKYNWTVSNQRLAREEVPIIELEEFAQSTSATWASLQYWKTHGAQLLKGLIDVGTGGKQSYSALTKKMTDAEVYAALYVADPTGNTYKLPFYDKYHHNHA